LKLTFRAAEIQLCEQACMCAGNCSKIGGS